MKILILISCLAFNAQAEWSIGQFLASHHSGSKNVTNENHTNSLYGCFDNYCGGFYENSYSTKQNTLISRFGLYRTNSVTWQGIRFNAVAGLADGYKGIKTDHEYMPFLGVTVIIGPVKLWQIGHVSAVGWEVSF